MVGGAQLPVDFEGDGAGAGVLSWGQRDLWRILEEQDTARAVPVLPQSNCATGRRDRAPSRNRCGVPTLDRGSRRPEAVRVSGPAGSQPDAQSGMRTVQLKSVLLVKGIVLAGLQHPRDGVS
jgi:hypothetical protein